MHGMLSKVEYNEARALCDAANKAMRDNWPEWEKGGLVPESVTSHPDYLACTNEIRGKVEQYEILTNTPETIFAYIGAPMGNGMGCDGVAGQSYPVTVWTGEKIGNATKGATWRVGRYGDRLSQFYARINGREFTGRSQGQGMYIKLKETADSKRSRLNKQP